MSFDPFDVIVPPARRHWNAPCVTRITEFAHYFPGRVSRDSDERFHSAQYLWEVYRGGTVPERLFVIWCLDLQPLLPERFRSNVFFKHAARESVDFSVTTPKDLVRKLRTFVSHLWGALFVVLVVGLVVAALFMESDVAQNFIGFSIPTALTVFVLGGGLLNEICLSEWLHEWVTDRMLRAYYPLKYVRDAEDAKLAERLAQDLG